MKVIILTVTLVAGVFAGVIPPKRGGSCSIYASDINYYFYSAQNPKNPIKVPSSNIGSAKNTHFNKAKQSIILIHGYGGDSTGPLVTTVRDTIFSKAKKDLNLIALDWGPLQNRNVTFTACLPIFAKMAQNFLNTMQKDFGLKLSDLTIVGHSYAGKILGAIGPQMNGQIQNLVVLEGDSVAKSAAKYVEYIKTADSNNGAVYGHVTYYPNGGPNQPGCSDWKCNHWRVIDLYAESLISKRFVARKCDSYANYKAGKCNNNPTAIMGQLQPDTRAQGLYFLYTNAKSPFARG